MKSAENKFLLGLAILFVVLSLIMLIRSEDLDWLKVLLCGVVGIVDSVFGISKDVYDKRKLKKLKKFEKNLKKNWKKKAFVMRA